MYVTYRDLSTISQCYTDIAAYEDCDVDNVSLLAKLLQAYVTFAQNLLSCTPGERVMYMLCVYMCVCIYIRMCVCRQRLASRQVRLL